MTILNLTIEQQNNKSVITDSYYTSPLKLGTPVVDNGDRLNVVLMMASAGLLAGDQHDYKIFCKTGTHSIITDQSYTKVFDTGDGFATKSVDITLESQASLLYKPHSMIPFTNSNYDGSCHFRLHHDSELVYTDIFACGRVGMGEKFNFQKYQNYVMVEIDNKPVWIDNCRLLPSLCDLEGPVFFDGKTHMGTLYYYGPHDKMNQLLAFVFQNSNLQYGISRALQGVSIRCLGYSSQDIEEEFNGIYKMLLNE